MQVVIVYIVNVMCGGSDLEMKVCYEPHSHVNFSDGWVMAAENHASDINCVGHTVDANASAEAEWCAPGMQALAIDITGEAKELKCGTHLGIAVRSSVLYRISVAYQEKMFCCLRQGGRYLISGVYLFLCWCVSRIMGLFG